MVRTHSSLSIIDHMILCCDGPKENKRLVYRGMLRIEEVLTMRDHAGRVRKEVGYGNAPESKIRRYMSTKIILQFDINF